jgi:hypothetical protein
MKFIGNLKTKLSGLYDAISRYPLTVLFLLAAASVNAKSINLNESFYKLFLTFVVGGCLSFVAQATFERFFEKFSHRLVLMVMCILLTLGYFLIVNQHTTTNLETWIRTSVAIFALFIAYIWIPVIKSNICFNESFMCSFKSFFNSLLFSVVIFIGISLIIGAIDLLLFQVDEKAYMHALNIISVLFAPIYFLSLIPVYPGISNEIFFNKGIDDTNEKIARSSICPKFLQILISYIIIPLLSIYTVILVIYIAKNITGKFWIDNRLEPMIVSFAITVILLHIIVSSIENNFSKFFLKFFPKILVPIVLFQIVSSILKSQETGITYGRYYVILFGIFAAISGILLSFIPIQKNSIVAILLISFALFSIIPPVDAFTISRTNQLKMLENVLIKNNMLKDNKIIPNGSVTNEDKKIISNIIDYLKMMEYTKDISYLKKDFNIYNNFYDTFGFYQYEEILYRQESVHISLDRKSPIIVSGYDALIVANFYFDKDNQDYINKLCEFKKAGETYTISNTNSFNSGKLWLSNSNGEELITVNIKDVFDMFDTSILENNQMSTDSLASDQATFMLENDNAIISLVALNLNIEKSNSQYPYSGDFYVLVKIK